MRRESIKRATNRAAILVAAAAAALAPATAQAVSATWTSTAAGTYNWTDAANWDAGVPNGATETANLSVGLLGNIGVALPSSVTVGSLTLGGTAGAVTTDIGNANSGGGTLIFDNTGGVGNPTLGSGGVAGSVNLITAPVQLNQDLDFVAGGTNSLTLGGNVTLNGGNRAIRHTLGSGLTFTLGATPGGSSVFLYDVTTPLTSRNFTISGHVANSTTIINTTFVRGDGTTTGGTGNVVFGGAGSQVTAKYLLNTPQTTNAAMQFNKQTYIFAHDTAAGTGTITVASNNNTSWGARIESTDDARVIANNITNGNGVAFSGANSITHTGTFQINSNNRPIGNILPAGKTLTMNGQLNMANDSTSRTVPVDGTGTTIINGKLVNSSNDPSNLANGVFEKRGTGTVTLNNPLNENRGQINVPGGLLNFGAAGTWGATSGINVEVNGAVWYVPGSADANFASGTGFLSKILPASTGALALPASEAAANFDFTAAPLSNAAGMSLGVQGDVTYTGTVTPGASGYHWGSRTGNLTLNGNNRMTGANAVTYKNGGTVIVNGTQDYTGVTTIAGANMARTGQLNILAGTQVSTSTFTPIFFSTVLEINQIANGGSPSTLGASGSDAANLVFNGGTLRYTGNGSTDRLFTINPLGATIDASGTGPLQFTNAGANVSAGTGTRTLTLTGGNTGDNTIAGSLSDASVGNALGVTKTGAGTWLLSGANTYTGSTTVSAGKLAIGATFTSSASITVAGGATMQMTAGGDKTLGTKSLTVAAGGLLDMTDGDMIVDYVAGSSPEFALRDKVLLFRDGGGTEGIGFTETVEEDTILAFGEAAELGITDFKGIAVDADTVVGKYTYYGDANFDGQVTTDDYVAVDLGLGTGNSWVQGDFDLNGVVTTDDYVVVDLNLGKGTTNPLAYAEEQAAMIALHTEMFGQSYVEKLAYASEFGWVAASVPEPGAMSLVGLGALGLLGRRKRR